MAYFVGFKLSIFSLCFNKFLHVIIYSLYCHLVDSIGNQYRNEKVHFLQLFIYLLFIKVYILL